MKDSKRTVRESERLASELNAYEQEGGENFWQDVVELYETDWRSIEAVDPNADSNLVILLDGGRVRYDPSIKKWEVE